MDLIFAAAGLALLLVAGDMLVRGAVALGIRLGVPALVIGLSVVAFGTSAPELLVSIKAALDGVPGIAVGNVVGSNIANSLLVLGIPALIAPVVTATHDTRRSYLQMLAASLVLIVLCFFGPLRFWHAGILLTLFAIMLADMFRQARAGAIDVAGEIEAPGPPLTRSLAYIGLGVVGLPLGAQLFIEGAVGISRAFGISEEVIGLTLVAIGTSLPDLATTTMATIRGRVDVALGNVIGSNLFNILLILGVTSLFGPVRIDAAFLTRDLWVMLGASLVLLPCVFRGWRISRAGGGLFLLAYAGYTVLLFL